MNLREIDSMFWERLVDMPDVEAMQELNLRRDELTLENAMLKNASFDSKSSSERNQLGVAIQENNALITKINSHIRLINDRMQNVNYKKAVLAIFGEDGYFKVREWIMIEEVRLKSKQNEDG